MHPGLTQCGSSLVPGPVTDSSLAIVDTNTRPNAGYGGWKMEWPGAPTHATVINITLHHLHIWS